MRTVLALECLVDQRGAITVRRPETDIRDSGFGLIPMTPLEELLEEGYELAPVHTPPGVCGYNTVAVYTPE
jgi:hypothetical protein